MKSGRRRARELALQGLYQWQVAKHPVADIVAQLSEGKGFDKVDAAYFKVLLEGAIANAPGIEAAIAPHLDRKFAALSPIERGVLMIGAYELAYQAETPYKVVINESVEVAKTYGGTDGHKYVNGVLDKLAQQLRAGEVQEKAGSR